MLISIQRILFPTDFSEPAKEAKTYAMALAERFAAELHLVHVVTDAVPYPDAGSPWLIPDVENQRQIEAALQRLDEEIDPNWSVAHRLTRAAIVGFAVDEILKYAKDHVVDVIVIGTHGKSGLSRLIMGSVAEKVVRLADCPVLTVHPTGRQFVADNASDEIK